MTNLPLSDKRPPLNWRTIGMLALFAILVSSTVIAVDSLSPRNRTPATASAPASKP